MHFRSKPIKISKKNSHEIVYWATASRQSALISRIKLAISARRSGHRFAIPGLQYIEKESQIVFQSANPFPNTPGRNRQSTTTEGDTYLSCDNVHSIPIILNPNNQLLGKQNSLGKQDNLPCSMSIRHILNPDWTVRNNQLHKNR